MNAQLPDDLLARLSGFVTDVYGLRFPPDRWRELGRGIASAALELAISDLEGWAEALVAGTRIPEQLTAIANHLTISETYFFRQQDAFNALEKDILPARIATRRERRSMLRIWSAGCASGEEPYSVAILLHSRFPDLAPETLSIVGSDINSYVLARAQRGIYSEWSFRDAPGWLKPRYFRSRPGGRYELVPEIRKLVRFVALNLAAPLYPAELGDHGDFDVVLCRNVLMYFSAEWQERILRRLVASLAPGGWLLVGPCDVSAELAVELRMRSGHPGIFHKLSGDAPPAAGRPLQAPMAASMAWPADRHAVLRVAAGAAEAGTDRAAPAAFDARPAGAGPPLPTGLPLDEIARAHADRGELDEALAACDAALAADNMNADLHHLRACVQMELGRWAEAEAGFKRVLYLEPESVMAHFALASLARRAERAVDARHHFRQVLRVLARHSRGEPVPNGEGMTVGRLREVVETTMSDTAA